MNTDDNPYAILGVPTDADETAVKKAYFKAAKIYHPDKQKSDEDRKSATAKFARIADAYDLLSDPVRRYDWRMTNESKVKNASTFKPARTRPSAASPPPKRAPLSRSSSLSGPRRKKQHINGTGSNSTNTPRRKSFSGGRSPPVARRNSGRRVSAESNKKPQRPRKTISPKPLSSRSSKSDPSAKTVNTSRSTGYPRPENGRKKSRSRSLPSRTGPMGENPSPVYRKQRKSTFLAANSVATSVQSPKPRRPSSLSRSLGRTKKLLRTFSKRSLPGKSTRRSSTQ